MKSFDVLVFPSHREGFGLVLVEAMAAGRPVVASAVGPIPEIVVDGVTGLLVPSFDPAAYADGLARVLTEPATAGAMGTAGSQFARRFDWRRASIDLLAIYEELTGPDDTAP
jgi:glycosyltransferase involved in cell wall biosynthesis